MQTWKEKLNKKIEANYQDIISEQNRAITDEQFICILKKLIDIAPHSFQTLLRNDIFSRTRNFLITRTSFVDENATFSTRCWYVLNDRTQLITCHKCGKPIIRNIKVTSKQNAFWCSPACQGKDNYISKKIKHKSKKHISIPILPPECTIIYHDISISYDDQMNVKLLNFYELHKKTFSYWIDTEIELKEYLFEKSYPLDFTALKVETRVKWVIDKMQKFLLCKACSRQIDFKNVKMSHKWPDYCCSACKKTHQGKFSYDWHAKDIYCKMLQSELTQPMFSLDEFALTNQKTGEFRVECLKCGGQFELPFDINFYSRNGRRSYFRCPVCFPMLSKRKYSQHEVELFEYVKNTLGIKNVKRGDRSTIYPFELDIHPMKDHSDVAIEYNGIYWHSLENMCDKNHILNKVKKCEELGIRLINIWEDDFIKNRVKLFSLVKEILLDPDFVMSDITHNGTLYQFEVERMVFNKCWCFPGYELIAETGVEEVKRTLGANRQIWTTPTAGKLIYRKISDYVQ